MQKLNKGFSLFPLMVTLLAITAGAVAISAVTNKQDELDVIKQQQANATRVTEALTGFIAVEKRLSCPDSDFDGEEECTESTGQKVKSGGVPYLTLGLTKADVEGLHYVPYRGNAIDLTEATEVRSLDIPTNLPVNIDFTDREFNEPTVTSPENDETLKHNLHVQYLFDKFRVDIISNTAKSYPLPMFPDGIRISNSINANYINALANLRNQSFSAESGDELFNFSFGNDNYNKVAEIEAILHVKQDAFEYTNQLRTLSEKITPDATAIVSNIEPTIDSLQASISKLEQHKLELNSILSRYNQLKQSNSAVDGFYQSMKLPQNSDGSPKLFNLYEFSDQSGLNANDVSTLSGAVQSYALSLVEKSSNYMQEVNSIFGTSITTLKDKTQGYFTGELKTDSGEQSQVGYFSQLSEDALSESNSGSKGDPDLYRRIAAHYEKAGDLMTGLYSDLYQRDDSVIEQYTNAFKIDTGAVDDFNDTAKNQKHICEEVESNYPRPKFNFSVTRCKEENAKGKLMAYLEEVNNTAQKDDSPDNSRNTDSFVYNPYKNMGDFCYKLALLDWLDAGKPSNAFSKSVPSTIATSLTTSALRTKFAKMQSSAFVLVRTGNNQRLDNNSSLQNNNGLFLPENTVMSSSFDDIAQPTTANSLSTQLGCPALLESYRSMELSIKIAEFMHSDASGVLVSAERAQAQAVADTVMASAKLASSTATAVASGVKAAGYFSTCAGSLGFAVSFCIAGGVQVGSTIAYGVAAAADGALVGLAAKQLKEANSDEAEARKSLNNATSNLADAARAGVTLDQHGGLKELNN
ncbi:hypothetical protein EAG18_00700 [Pseudoalteromonas sp. J010]|uniref:hypothetical protein n=1 Tax=Pseudoalteromonas sp. J010 TaxID=998465 RepID=UPI000F648BC9|nr:hypothetical protein [Pseudoalteromonas sp. J010]RRS10578.1 hypothetical protein EAG18_00700 [Pseudoalteromonas sp. J010]